MIFGKFFQSASWILMAIVGLAGASVLADSAAKAQQTPPIVGDFAGVLGPLHLKLHLTASPTGVLSGTLDSPDQGAIGIPCTNVHLTGQSLIFTVPTVQGSWQGTVSSDGNTLSGAWTQGNPLPLNFTRDTLAHHDTFVPAEKPSPVDGIWLGTLHAGAQSLHIQLHIRSDKAGQEFCTLDSLDQHAMGLECANVVLTGSNFSLDVPVVRGSWKGTLSSDGKTLTGTWNQGIPLPLNLLRQPVASK